MNTYLTACPPGCTCRGSFSEEDEQFLGSYCIVLDKPEPLPEVPVIATAFYAAVFSAFFYAALYWICLL